MSKKAVTASMWSLAGLAALSICIWIILLWDWRFGNEGSPWSANGVTACVVLSFFPALMLTIMLGYALTHRWTKFLDIFDIWTEHARSVNEAEKRGEAPA